MYIKINLLPPEIRARWERERKKRAALLTVGAVLAIFIVIYGALVLTTWQVWAEVAGLQQERNELAGKITALQQYAQMYEQVKQTEGLIKEAVGNPPEWKSIMVNIGLNIPMNLWLTDLSFTNEKNEAWQSTNVNNNMANNQAAGELTIRGYAYESNAVTQWQEKMRQIPALTNVNCQFSSKEELDGEPIINFEIKATVLTGQPTG